MAHDEKSAKSAERTCVCLQAVYSVFQFHQDQFQSSTGVFRSTSFHGRTWIVRAPQKVAFRLSPIGGGSRGYRMPIILKEGSQKAVWGAWERAGGASLGGHDVVLSTIFNFLWRGVVPT